MNEGVTVNCKLPLKRHGQQAKVREDGAKPSRKPATNPVPRISHLMVHVTRDRVTQIMNLLHLAPDIHEDLLFRAPPKGGRQTITEKSLIGVNNDRCG